jgi:hypothetical protein
MKRVMLELRHNPELTAAATEGRAVAPPLSGFRLDEGFAPVALPALLPPAPSEDARATGESPVVDATPGHGTWLVRGEMAEGRAMPKLPEGVVGIYADAEVQPAIICPGSGPLGTHLDVERLVGVPALQRCGMDGAGVLVAIVDTGVNMARLNAAGKTPTFDAARSFSTIAGVTPGSAAVGHGTMCAFDACIAAPRCTLLDIAVLGPATGGFAGLLSDIVRAYGHLQTVMSAPRRPGEARSLVVNNSWALFNMASDFPVGDPRNYSDNANHPMNRAVAALEALGADILFAAGNCGGDCPDGRCDATTSTIRGANSHPAVLSVAGVDTTRTRVGYSSVGPGRLARNKPDISGYTHFSGSGVFAADGGTSAACPVVAGVVAALRSIRPFNPADVTSHPAAIRSFMTATASDLGTTGYDFAHGFGVVSGSAIARRSCATITPGRGSLCERYPFLCDPPKIEFDLCRRYPWLCDKSFVPPLWPRPRPPVPVPPRPDWRPFQAGPETEEPGPMAEPDPVELAYIRGVQDGWAMNTGPAEPAPAKGCGCRKD